MTESSQSSHQNYLNSDLAVKIAKLKVPGPVATEELLHVLQSLSDELSLTTKPNELRKAEVLRAEIIKLTYLGFSKCDPEPITSLIKVVTADNFMENTSSSKVTREVMLNLLSHLKRAFPDWSYDIEEPVASGDTVAIRGVMRGTNDGPFLTIGSSHKRVQVPFSALHRFQANGKLVERWMHWDQLIFLQQLDQHRFYQLDYEYFTPVPLVFTRPPNPLSRSNSAASNTAISAPIASQDGGPTLEFIDLPPQYVTKGVDFTVKLRLRAPATSPATPTEGGSNAGVGKVKALLLDVGGVLLPKVKSHKKTTKTQLAASASASTLSVLSGGELLSGGHSATVDSTGCVTFTLKLSDRPSSHDAVRIGFLVDNQIRLKSPPIRVTHRAITSPRTPIGSSSRKAPEVLHVIPDRIPRFGRAPNDSGRRVVVNSTPVHLSANLQCRLSHSKKLISYPQFAFYNAELFYVDVPTSDSRCVTSIQLSNDNGLMWSNQTNGTIELYDVPYEKGINDFPDLHYAAYYGNLEQTKLLLQKTNLSDPTSTLDGSGHTALYWAIHEDRIAVVTFLLSQMKGKPIDTPNPITSTSSLSSSSSTSHLGQSSSSNPEVGSATPVHPPESHVMLASRLGRVECLKELLKAGASLLQTDSRGQTPLIVAAKHGHLSVVQLLTEHSLGSVLDSKDVQGFTAVRYCSLWGHLSPSHAAIYHHLVSKGAVVEGDATSLSRKATRLLEELLSAYQLDKNARGWYFPVNSLSSAEAKILSHGLRNNTTLKILDLSGNKIGVDGAKELADALRGTSNTTLTEFRAADCQIGDDGVRSLCKALRTHSAIKVLDLSENAITDVGCKAICKVLRDNETLYELDLGRNAGISDEGARGIAAALERNQSLRILYLGECSITADGEQAIGRTILINPTKRAFYMRANSIGIALMPTPQNPSSPAGKNTSTAAAASSAAKDIRKDLTFNFKADTAGVNELLSSLKSAASGLDTLKLTKADFPDNLDDLEF